VLISRHKDPARLYMNDQGFFSEVNQGQFSGKDRHDCEWADVNQDGLEDFFCSVGGLRGIGIKGNDMEIQLPGQSFVEKTGNFGLLDPYGRGRNIAFIDVNHDEYPDLFVGNVATRVDGMPGPSRLLINVNGSSFRDAPKYHLDQQLGGSCAQAADFDNDGWQDLLVCHAFNLGVRLFRNVNGTDFSDVTSSMRVAPGGNFGTLTDLDGDGDLDLVSLNGTRLTVQLQANGTFRTVFTQGLTAGVSVAVGDVDGDARPDLYVVQGGEGNPNDPDIMLLNGGDGTIFTEIPIPETTEGCGDVAVTIDYNQNGLDDFIVLNGCGPSDTPGPIQLISFYPS